ncbi:MAG: lytic transglycosylase domain-containing protein [Cyanobacteria bacterium K_DeepCast_35m_m2_023]|nr:lytic transglycosylase domain-containing protein [Cyanobacteria bacterium K_DeepCast_35m_m2_023]
MPPRRGPGPLRLTPLLAATSLGTLAALVGAQALVRQLPRPTPDSSVAALALQWRLALNPERRREAALLLSAAAGAAPARQLTLLTAQGWGRGAAAAVALKQQALAAKAMGQSDLAQRRWQLLLRRLPHEPASADALYALGQQQPALRQTLLQRWPAHPAALAAASEHPQLAGPLHLARWGARWPGAASRLAQACQRRDVLPAQRQQLAQGLAQVGASAGALRCLGTSAPQPATSLLLAEAELGGSGPAQQLGIARLQELIRRHPNSPEAEPAVRLLAEQSNDTAARALAQLPPRWRHSAPVQAALAQRQASPGAALAVLRRWPSDRASWELQWQLARRAALANRWQEARTLLAAGGSRLDAAMPLALQMRRRFWWGLSEWQLQRPDAARRHWRQIVREHPGGYYGWRAASRLQPAIGRASTTGTAVAWAPLDSGDGRADRLWRLGQPLEAWEAWRANRRGQVSRSSRDLQAEGRLRESIGDGWTGIGQQELAALRLPPGQCQLQQRIEAALYQPRQRPPLAAAARDTTVPLPLLLGVAKQESRFQSTVRSVVGAAGLLQLMPETAAEVAGGPVTRDELNDPARNAMLGARYLQQLLQRWDNNPLLAVASYNAGPNAVARWLGPNLQTLPEVWVEAIPYPETRHYVKTVLGNSWSFAQPRHSACS